MSPKQYAEELVEDYYSTIMSFLSDNMKWENAKKGATIAVDRILKVGPQLPISRQSTIFYWEEVKQEIQKL